VRLISWVSIDRGVSCFIVVARRSFCVVAGVAGGLSEYSAWRLNCCVKSDFVPQLSGSASVSGFEVTQYCSALLARPVTAGVLCNWEVSHKLAGFVQGWSPEVQWEVLGTPAVC